MVLCGGVGGDEDVPLAVEGGREGVRGEGWRQARGGGVRGVRARGFGARGVRERALRGRVLALASRAQQRGQLALRHVRHRRPWWLRHYTNK